MATIAGVDVGGFGLPEQQTRILNRSIGVAASGTVKIKKFRDADLEFMVKLNGKTTTVKNNLYTALAAAQTTTIAIAPDAHIDVGNGAGTTVNACWIDGNYEPSKTTHDFWDIILRFRYSS